MTPHGRTNAGVLVVVANLWRGASAKSPRNQEPNPRTQGDKHLLVDTDEDAALNPAPAGDVAAEATTTTAEPAHDERIVRLIDEGDVVPVLTATELLLLGGREQGLGRVGEPHPVLVEVGIYVGPVDPAVVLLELISGDETELDLDDSFSLDRVVVVVDVLVHVAPRDLVPELHDDALAVFELELELYDIGCDPHLAFSLHMPTDSSTPNPMPSILLLLSKQTHTNGQRVVLGLLLNYFKK